MYCGMNRREMQALVALTIVAALGLGARAFMLSERSAGVWIERSSLRSPSSINSENDSSGKVRTPVQSAFLEDGRLDLNLARIEDLQTLDGIGEKRARTIINYRLRNGPFGDVKDLLGIARIGPKTFATIEPLIYVEPTSQSLRSHESPTSSSLQTTASFETGASNTSTDLAVPEKPRVERINVNMATAAELQSLWNIGEKKSEAIVRWRSSHGPFRSASDLKKVPGIGPETIKRNASIIFFGPLRKSVQIHPQEEREK